MTDQTTCFVSRAPRVYAGEDQLVHMDGGCGRPPAVMTRRVALAIGRSLFAAVAELEDRETDAAPPARLHRAN